MRVTTTIDAHVGDNGGAYWVAAAGINVFTQSRSGVVKRFVAHRNLETGDQCVDDDSDDDDEELPTNFELAELINEEENYDFCACALYSASPTIDKTDAPADGDVMLAIPRAEGRVSIFALTLSTNKSHFRCKESILFHPKESRKLGMCMSLAFGEVNPSTVHLFVGYEDGSLVLWSSARPAADRATRTWRGWVRAS